MRLYRQNSQILLYCDWYDNKFREKWLNYYHELKTKYSKVSAQICTRGFCYAFVLKNDKELGEMISELVNSTMISIGNLMHFVISNKFCNVKKEEKRFKIYLLTKSNYMNADGETRQDALTISTKLTNCFMLWTLFSRIIAT